MTSTCMMPFSRAISLPTFSGRCSVAISASSVRRGSITNSSAPFLTAFFRNVAATGWASVIFDPITRNIFAVANSVNEFVIAPEPKRGRQTGDRWRVSGTGAVIDVVRTDHRAKQLLHLVGIFVNAPGAADAGYGIRAVLAIISLNLFTTRLRASSQEASRARRFL